MRQSESPRPALIVSPAIAFVVGLILAISGVSHAQFMIIGGMLFLMVLTIFFTTLYFLRSPALLFNQGAYVVTLVGRVFWFFLVGALIIYAPVQGLIMAILGLYAAFFIR